MMERKISYKTGAIVSYVLSTLVMFNADPPLIMYPIWIIYTAFTVGLLIWKGRDQ